jgi:alkylation response protein AidB-like acyl-CoA dehydrogenase
MLNLEFTEEQEMLREMVRGLCTQYAGDDQIREVEDDPTGYSAELWGQLGELGLLGLMLPEEHGGAGSGPLDGVVLYEELGRSLAPTPHLESCVMSAGALLEAGSDEQVASLLPGIASGEAIVVPAWVEPNNSFGPRGVQMRAAAAGDSFVLNGTKEAVRFGSAADKLVVLARTGDADTDIDLFLVDPNSAGVTMEQRMSISSDARYRVDFDNVTVSASDRIGAAGSGWETWSKVMDQVMVLAAAFANGGNEYALEITVQYSKDREQFDKPLGAFQALAHDMANAKTAVDGAKLLNYEAAWALGQELDPNVEPSKSETSKSVTQLAAMSKLFSCNSYRDTTAMAQQIFGGVGFTLEYEIQLYFRRAKALQVSFNDTRRCEDLIAAAVLD